MRPTEKEREYLQGKLDAIDGCIGHLSIAIQELGSRCEFQELKYNTQKLLEDAKEIKLGILAVKEAENEF